MFKKNKKEVINKELQVIRKYNGTYDLNKIIRDCIPWEAGNCMIQENENVLFKIYYRNTGPIIEKEDEKKWFGNNDLLIYIVEEKEKFKIKYINLRDTEEKAINIANEIITNLGCYQTFDIGYSSKQYKEYIRKEKMIEIAIEADLYSQIENLGNIKYDDIEYFTYKKGTESIDYCDYVNKKYFYCDVYCLEKYKPCIELVEKIIKKCNILNLSELKFQYFKENERTKIMEKLIEDEIEASSWIY